jgi:hypothetical protein
MDKHTHIPAPREMFPKLCSAQEENSHEVTSVTEIGLCVRGRFEILSRLLILALWVPFPTPPPTLPGVGQMKHLNSPPGLCLG